MMLEMILALALVAIFVVVTIATARDSNQSACNGDCLQGRTCDCKDRI
jgi:hypothetical protein